MRKLLITLSIAAAFVGMTGCGANNEQAGQGGEGGGGPLPIGYYSNENHGGGGNVILNEDNDGPVTEMMDHTFGAEGKGKPSPQDGEGRNNNGTGLNNENDNILEKINTSAEDVKGVEDARTIVSGKQVLIAAKITDKNQAEKVKTNIKNAVKDHTDGRSLTVVTDNGTYNRVKDVENGLRSGRAQEQMKEDVENLFRSLKPNTQQGKSK